MSKDRDYYQNRPNNYQHRKYNNLPYNRNSNNNNYNQNSNFNTRQQNFIRLNETNALIYIHPYSSYNLPLPELSKPTEIGILLSERKSINNIKANIFFDCLLHLERIIEIESKTDKKHEYEKFKGIKYLALPNDCDNLNFDLKIGLEKFVPHIPHQNGIDSLLKWILSNKSPICSLDNSSRPLKTDFICWRGLLTTMCVSPYEKFKDWMFSIILHKGTYYLCEIETEAHKNERLNQDERGRSFTYWGHKFETYITTDIPGENPADSDEVPNPENNFSTIVRNKIADHDLIYGAEIDCCVNSEHTHLGDYCEIKSSQGESIKDLNFAKNIKFLKWWIQSFLVDISLIKVGLRNDDGIIKKIIDCNIQDILVPNRWWKENVCLNLIKEVLDSIKKFCTQENHVYIASRELGSNTIKIYKTRADSDEFKQNYFLPDWYTSAI